MPEMTALQGRTRDINIVEGIGAEWDKVGTALLDDKDGTIIPAIARDCGYKSECINMEILRRWIQGKGIPDRTWKGILCVLRNVRCISLADSVDEVLTEEEAEQGKPSTDAHTHARTHARMHTRTRTHTRTHTHTHACTHVCMHAQVRMHACTHTHTCTLTHTHTDTHACTHVCTHAHTHTHTHTHTRIRTHVRTHTK